jgi:isocitrate dehydrogenase
MIVTHSLIIFYCSCQTKGDFYGSEQSTTMANDTDVSIEFTSPSRDNTIVLKESTKLEKGEVIDASSLDVSELCEFLAHEMDDAKASEVLFSLHLKATMMKVSDPIMFGHCIRVFYKTAFDKHAGTLQHIGADPNQGLGSILDTVAAKCDAKTAMLIQKDFEACYEDRPWLAMVNSDKGITNLHAPNDSKY